jgi:hypothetical protein
MSDLKYLVQEYATLQADSQVARAEWQRIGEFLAPQLQSIVTRGVEGYKKTRKLYDTTGIDAADKLVTLIVGTATSEVVRWFSLAHQDTDINLFPEVQYWLEDTAQRMFQAISASNYKVAGPEAIRDIVIFGTGNVYVEEIDPVFNPIPGFRGLYFTGVPIGSYVIQEDGLNRVRFETREFVVPIRSVIERWPKGEYSRDTLKLAEEKPYQRVSVLHDVRPDKKRFLSSYYVIPRAAGMGMSPMNANIAQAEQCSQGFYPEFPHMIPRWDKATGEVWGFGRGHLALPEVATLNRARQLKLRQWALSVNPPILALDDGVVSTPRIVAGAVNRVRVDGALKGFETGMNFQHESIPENESKLQIRQIFYTEQILQFAPQAKTPPSATEVVQRMEFLHQLLGPALGRLQQEFLTPMLKRVFNIMKRADAFLPMPAILEADGRLQIEFEGPLARSQRAEDLRAIGDTLAVVSNLAAYDPEVIDNYDLDFIARDTARITGASKRYVRDPEERDARREARRQQQAQQAQLAAMQQGSEAARNLGQASASFAKSQEQQ